MEEWRDIKGYEALYQVSDWGRVKSLANNKSRKEKLLKTAVNNKGYLQINLWKNGKMKVYKVHRLVAEAFIENPEGLPQINHKDENKINNRVENLEWCDGKYNMNYGTRTQRISKQVFQYTLDGELVAIWPSIMECGRNGYSTSGVSACCNGKRKVYKGYVWSFNILK